MKVSSELWDPVVSKEIYLFTLSSEQMEVNVSNYGCTVNAIVVKTSGGGRKNIVLGYETLTEYIVDKYYMGCIVGRFAGRINNACFEIKGKKYQLACNEKENHLHGGVFGFNQKVFSVLESDANDRCCYVKFETTSEHLEEGYPGKLHLVVTVALSNENEISISYEASTDAPTHVNLTHHHYFNLSGGESAGWEQHLQLNASQYLEQDDFSIPNGRIISVKNSRRNFSEMRPIKYRETDDGFNEYFALDSKTFEKADAVLIDPQSGLSIVISTTYPCIVLYSGDYLSKPFTGAAGICLETQFFPDSPNQSHFPSTVLLPGNIYFHKTNMLVKNII